MATGKVNKVYNVKKTTVTGTTSAAGAINTGLNNKPIIGVEYPSQSATCSCVLSKSTSGAEWVTIFKIADWTKLASTDVEIDVYYLDT